MEVNEAQQYFDRLMMENRKAVLQKGMLSSQKNSEQCGVISNPLR